MHVAAPPAAAQPAAAQPAAAQCGMHACGMNESFALLGTYYCICMCDIPFRKGLHSRTYRTASGSQPRRAMARYR